MKKIFLLCLLILLGYLAHYYYAINLLSIQKNLFIINKIITDNFILATLCYMGIYILSLITFLPIASLLTLLAGLFFGLYMGVILVFIASNLGAILSFLISRYIFKDYFQLKFKKIFKLLNNQLQGNNTYTYLFFLRLNPLFSFTILNFVLGLTNIRLKTYMLTTSLGCLLGTIIYVNAGRSLTNINSIADVATFDVLFSLSLLSLLPFIIAKILQIIETYTIYKPFKKPKKYDYDMVVIGAGSAGLVSAYMGAFFKAKVALIEEHKMGGDCLNYGCVPSKALINYANDFYIAKSFNPNLALNFNLVKDSIKQAIISIAPKDCALRYENLGVNKIITGSAVVNSPFEVKVNNEILTTKNIIIATGAKPIIPNIEGLDKIDYLTSNNIWEIQELPNTLIILGAGIIAIELGIAFAKLGSKVIIIELGDKILANYEPEVAQCIHNQFAQLQIQLLLNCQIINMDKINNTTQLTIQNNLNNTNFTLTCSHFLIAIGRKPNLANINLPALKLNSRLGVEVNGYLQTNYKNIYACGDAISRYQLTHVAGFEAPFVVINLLFGFIKKIKINYHAIPAVIYSSPDIAQVGLTSMEAKLQNIEYEIAFEHLQESDGAITSNQNMGFIKIIFDKKSKHILGATICAKNAGIMIAEYVMAIRLNLKINAIYNNIYAYPTINDIGKIALQKYRAKILNKRIFTLFKLLHKIRNIL
jgi:pyruvate/2-oxoglutarate dehydrogenase complex dihydrolipoamide dehydrogenase (E3) component/uncharacterized membrane protein YdjX (TVP38/TMEM64 family)